MQKQTPDVRVYVGERDMKGNNKSTLKSTKLFSTKIYFLVIPTSKHFNQDAQSPRMQNWLAEERDQLERENWKKEK